MSLISEAPLLPWAGYSFRMLFPRTGHETGSILIDEVTFDSLVEHDDVIRDVTGRPENAELMGRLRGLERRPSDVSLYRLVE